MFFAIPALFFVAGFFSLLAFTLFTLMQAQRRPDYFYKFLFLSQKDRAQRCFSLRISRRMFFISNVVFNYKNEAIC
ncbi:hypothetical protein C4F51_12935 [Cellvibrio sp. KB43]|uniref:Uncharacterized protein n=1 Tax=Cellvibrio polysaccharolyticus TaxID=2082724 RepID=A0A928YUL1_9GAMM|nr:hypothetical protein [Cellvibrio polysaccharolyticus]